MQFSPGEKPMRYAGLDQLDTIFPKSQESKEANTERCNGETGRGHWQHFGVSDFKISLRPGQPWSSHLFLTH